MMPRASCNEALVQVNTGQAGPVTQDQCAGWAGKATRTFHRIVVSVALKGDFPNWASRDKAGDMKDEAARPRVPPPAVTPARGAARPRGRRAATGRAGGADPC